MTTHERCAAAIEFRPVDRLPTHIPAIACDVASQILGRPAYAGTGSLHYAEVNAHANGPAAHAEFETQLRQDMIDLHRALEIDVFSPPWRMNVKPSRRIDEYTFVIGDESAAHEVWKYEPGTADFSPIHSVKPPIEIEDHARHALEDAEANETSARQALIAEAREHRTTADLIGDEFFYVVSGGMISAGYDSDSLMALALSPRLVAQRLMIRARLAVEAGRALQAVGLPAILRGGGDLAGAQGPFYSPATFRDVVLPAYRYAVHALNDLGAHYMFRSDGNIWSLANMLFIDAACPGFGEADRTAGMTVAELRKRFPKLVIWGNVPSEFLVHANAAQVRDLAREIADEADGLGYFQACSNAIVQGTPPANVEALFSVR